jgi:hypothetical protein
MFMAFENLNLHSTIWPGLKWLLPDGRPEKPWFAPPTFRCADREKSVFETRKISGRSSALSSGQSRGQEIPGPKARKNPSSGTLDRHALPRELWPGHWRSRFEATRRGRLVWTYWELGQDICGVPDVERRDFLRRLIADLAYQPGTHTFFPVCLPEVAARDSAPVFMPNPEVFWSALELLGSRGLLILGDKATKALELEKDISLWGMARRRNFFVWRLPGVESVSSDARAYSNLLEFLRIALRDVTRGVGQGS